MKLNGTIIDILFRNEINGWTVLLVKTSKAVFQVVGILPLAYIGININAEVLEIQKKGYGKEYELKSYDMNFSNEVTDIRDFLNSLNIKGINVKVVENLVDEFYEETIDIILYELNQLQNVKGMTVERIEKLYDKVNEIDSIMKISSYLNKYSLDLLSIRNIIKKFGNKTIEKLEDNPYILSTDVEGIDFLVCDEIALNKGILRDNINRIKASIIYVLKIEYQKGNVFVFKDDLYKFSKKVLRFEEEFFIDDILCDLQLDDKIKVIGFENNVRVYLFDNYYMEESLSKMLYKLRDNIEIITGGPGTGKTYNIKKYINDAIAKDMSITLCAPTGRAAKRMTEVTGYEAKTIHRTLQFMNTKEENLESKRYFQKNKDNPIDTDLIIVDEMSMVDNALMYHLMLAIKDNTKIVFVGDVDQLPSVGAGNVLKDMIDSNIFKVKKLSKIYRQEEGSNIVLNAHKVNMGEKVDLTIECDDFKFVYRNNENMINDTIKKLVSINIPKHFNIDKNEIQVICPSKMGACGIDILNSILQESINPRCDSLKELKIGKNIFRENDKVMQIKNNYDLIYDIVDENGIKQDEGMGVFNGDIGIIKKIDLNLKIIIVKFDDRIVEYEKDNILDLKLAYAITVHKSQGSEYDVVVMPMSFAPRPLLNRKVLYTAMTRAKKCICFVGKEDIFNEMIDNNYEGKRNSSLCDKNYLYI